MKKFEKTLDTVMRFLMALSMFALLVFGTLQIFGRWLGMKITFTDELLRYILILAGLLGSAYCFYRDEHLALTLITDKAKGGFKVVLDVFIELCILFFVIYVFIYGGWRYSTISTDVSSVMHIPMKYLIAIEPICGIMIVLARILKYIQLLTDKKGGKEA